MRSMMSFGQGTLITSYSLIEIQIGPKNVENHWFECFSEIEVCFGSYMLLLGVAHQFFFPQKIPFK